MNLAYRMKLVATLSIASLGALVGCSSDDSSTPGGTDAGKDTSVSDGGGSSDTSTGTDTGSNVDSGGGTDAGTNDGSTGDDGGDEAGALSCTAYCAAIATNCSGDNKQYQTDAECMTACALFAPGASSDKSGNTLGCRTYHAGLAASAAAPHCWHAGPFGFGGCGTACEDFCALTVAYCSPAGGFDAGAPPYATLADCTTACPGFTVPDAGTLPSTYGGAATPSGNTLDCREYHLGNALTSTANQKVHCPHAAVTSAACK